MLTAPEQIQQLCEVNKVTRILAASVAGNPNEYQAFVPAGCTFAVLGLNTPLPFKVHYTTPLTLGADRIAAVAGAQHLFAGKHVLVIDLGTCITYDLLLKDGTYYGGSISPGLAMRYKALHTFTARLPLVENITESIPLTGTTTTTAIQSGVFNGVSSELREICLSYRKQYPGLVIVLCGGDAPRFETIPDKPIFAVPELTLIGLATILQTLHA